MINVGGGGGGGGGGIFPQGVPSSILAPVSPLFVCKIWIFFLLIR